MGTAVAAAMAASGALEEVSVETEMGIKAVCSVTEAVGLEMEWTVGFAVLGTWVKVVVM